VGKGKRFFKLAGMTASVAGNYAKSRLKGVFQDAADAAKDRAELHSVNGERIAKTLGELKGAAMKVGQMASVAGDILPKELSGALKKLQKEAPPMPYEVIARQIEAELGASPDVLFEHFDKEPFAAASIGQVHRARVDDGREVVVKVQYPGVDKSVDSDLAHLKIALKASGLVKIKGKALNELFTELRARLHEELDYCNEADNVRYFKQYHSANHPFIVIPDVVGERSAKRVLTLTYEPGTNINELGNEGFDQAARDKIGEHLFEMTLSQIFDLQSIHADPNPANFSFRKDGTIVLYDFGCVKRLKPEIAEAYKNTLRAGVEEDYAGVEDGLIALGARNPDGPAVEHSYYKQWRDLFLTPFLSDEPFDYGASTVHDDVKRMIPGILKRIASFQPPAELVFVDRVVGGHYGNLRIIQSRGHFLDIVLRYIDAEAPES
jgi:predicted unusual protein kinase regulating ubiquinone biosynthesis (AarF/ABC1/UbiB family)